MLASGSHGIGSAPRWGQVPLFSAAGVLALHMPMFPRARRLPGVGFDLAQGARRPDSFRPGEWALPNQDTEQLRTMAGEGGRSLPQIPPR